MQDELNNLKEIVFESWFLDPRSVSLLELNGCLKINFMNMTCSLGNKARLIAQSYNQEEDIDYDESFAPATQLEGIRMLLVFASLKKISFSDGC